MAWDLVEDALATHRLTKLALDDKIAEPVRNKVYKKFPHETKIGYLVRCPWCLSMWIGFGVSIARVTAPRAWGIAARGLAASTVTGAIEERL